MYLGRQLTSGNYLKLDDISSQFNSSTITFNLTTAGQPFYPGSVFSVLISVGGSIQEPATSYTIDQATITFTSAPTTGSAFFGIVLGISLGVGVPGDGTVTGSKLSLPFNYNSGLLYLDSVNNRVGILSTSPTVALDVVGNSRVSGTTNLNGLSVTGIATLSGTTIFNPGPVLVGTATSTGTANQRLQVSGSAYVSSGLGIGTTSPSGLLDVSGGTIRVRNNGTYAEPLDNAGVLAYDSALSEFTVSSRSASTNSYLRFLTSNSGTSGERLRITAEGNLLVGTASSTGTASQPLQVSGGAYVSANLGVGRANPTYKIDVFGGSGLRVGGVSGDGYLLAYDTSSGNNVILEATDFLTTTKRNFAIQPNGGVVLVGTATSTGTASQPLQVSGGAYVSGNVGIGTTNPAYKLDVVGDVRVTGVVTATTFVGALTGTASSTTNIPNLTGDITSVNSVTSIAAGVIVDADINASAGIVDTKLATIATALKVSNSATTATNANTASAIVARDASGNFSAGTITASLTGTASLNVLKAGDTMTGQLISTLANSTTTGGGQIYLNGATGNRIDFAGVGVAAPAFTTRSAGTKIVLYPGVGGSSVDYALGIDSSTFWYSTYDSTTQFKWYAGTTNIATLFGTGQLVLGTTSLTGTASQPLQVTGGAYVSGNVGIGTILPSSVLDVASSNSGITLTNTGASNKKWRLGGSSAGSFLITETGVADRLTINNSGNVGINDSSPLGKLSIFTTSINTATDYYGENFGIIIGKDNGNGIAFTQQYAADGVDSSQIRVGAIVGYKGHSTGNFGGGLKFKVQPNGATPMVDAMVLTKDGNLGIGATIPGSKLQIVGDIRFGKQDYSYQAIQKVATLNADGVSGVYPPASFRFYTYPGAINTTTLKLGIRGQDDTNGETSDIITIVSTSASSGSVGIGTTVPLQKLHVNGNLLVSAGSSTGQHITQKAYELNSGTLSWEGSAGQLFSITNNLTSGSIFSVNDVSGIPSIDVNADGTVLVAPYGGNLGVGTISPTQKLHVQGNVRIAGGLYDSNNNVGAASSVLISTGSGISWAAASGGGATLTNDTTTNATYYPTFSSATSGTYSTAYVSNTKCTFNPSTGTLSATVFTSLSDASKKKNIRPIENAIEITKKLEGVRFDWKDTDAPSIGVIAQEVEKVLPELVVENDGVKSVSYGNIVGVLIEAIKEQQVRIEELERKLNA